MLGRNTVNVSMPKLVSEIVVHVRATGTRRAIWRLHLMRVLMAFAAWVGGVSHVDIDLSRP
jgi:hypothetical protein